MVTFCRFAGVCFVVLPCCVKVDIKSTGWVGSGVVMSRALGESIPLDECPFRPFTGLEFGIFETPTTFVGLGEATAGDDEDMPANDAIILPLP